ncbi:MAG: isoleucine--tRNA ligase [Planctomycetes bacterium]|nr:isoleucine--tRNA ligase [Planctomycetota bacterium]
MTDPSEPLFHPIAGNVSYPALEAEIREFWAEERIYERSKELRKDAEPFVFYEGPPTANGLPHNGHVLTRVIKDAFPRYKTMQGFHVPRKGGWDTHGLPVEIEVEKELGIRGKDAIREYGVEPFVRRCLESVFRYTKEWEENTQKLAFWIDLDTAYVTYHQSYIESVWWALSELHKKNLLYEGHKVIAWWAQGGTALSNAEVGEGYKIVDDPSVYVLLPLVDEPTTHLVAWTTSPWTLPSNCYVAVNAKYEYAYLLDHKTETQLVVAAAEIESLRKRLKRELTLIGTVPGKDLVGKQYVPPFDWFHGTKSHKDTDYWRVIAADFVTLGGRDLDKKPTGTGIVHVAPAFGQDDFGVLQRENRDRRKAGKSELPLICPVQPNGTFDPEQAKTEGVSGMFVKDADKVLIRDMEERGVLLHRGTCKHKYPFCPRSDKDPLIYIARPAWYIRTTREIHRAIENNAAVRWLPETIGQGRFGDFLRNNVDWALSRERFWGTPLNVWRNDETGALDVPDSVAAILERNPQAFEPFDKALETDPDLSPHLKVHKPWIDEVTWTKEGEAGVYRRVPDVIDCWFDSGSMPFAQHGYPHQGKDEFERYFPADFISEAIDQTRGWFYTLLMVSTLLFEDREYPYPYRNCVVLGHVCDRDGKKESKSKGNFTPPEVILDCVRLQMAALHEPDLRVPDGEGWIARADYEGLDLSGDGHELQVYREGQDPVTLMIRPASDRNFPLRLVALSAKDQLSLGVQLAPRGRDTLPKAVATELDDEHRLWLEDPNSPAPGADAFRWFFYASNPPWNSTRHSLNAVRQTQRELPIKVRNVHSFFVTYANIDGFNPADPACLEGKRPTKERALLDRWILSELALTTQSVTAHMDEFRIYEATQALTEFADGLSNWYVRRSRRRFYPNGLTPDKLDAHWTLYTCLTTLAGLLGPFLPYASEDIWRNLVRRPDATQPLSVHLSNYPAPLSDDLDGDLSAVMGAVREMVSLGLSVRAQNKLAVRQPLSALTVLLADPALATAVAEHSALIQEEVNVKEVVFASDAAQYVTYQVKPAFKVLAPRLRKDMPKVKAILAQADGGALLAEQEATGKITLDVEGKAIELSADEVQVALKAKDGFAAASGPKGVAVLATELTPELIEEGLYREVLRRVQDLRKQRKLDFAARVEVWVAGDEDLLAAVRPRVEHLASETLAEGGLHLAEPAEGVERVEVQVKKRTLVLGLREV